MEKTYKISRAQLYHAFNAASDDENGNMLDLIRRISYANPFAEEFDVSLSQIQEAKTALKSCKQWTDILNEWFPDLKENLFEFDQTKSYSDELTFGTTVRQNDVPFFVTDGVVEYIKDLRHLKFKSITVKNGYKAMIVPFKLDGQDRQTIKFVEIDNQ